MRPEFLMALEFAQEAEQESDPARLHERFGDVVRRFGVKYFSSVGIAVPGNDLRPRFSFGEVDYGWSDRYFQNAYYRFDPVIQMLFETAKPFAWREAAERFKSAQGDRLQSEVAEVTGAREGLVIPVHDWFGETSAVILSGPTFDPSPEVRPILHLVSVYFSSVGRDLKLEPEPDGVCPLTERQRECLRWVMDGKSDWEIGEILTISERTAHNHIEAAKRLLEVGTRTQAVVQAWRRGWLV
jgi:LuxR family quorum sensing-dependent transcriptional regulator